MTDIVFRSRVESTPPREEKASVQPHTASQVQIEAPFTSYSVEHSRPFSVDYYSLGDLWDDPDGFAKEVTTIEGYLQKLIERGEIANSQKAVTRRLKEVEKVINVKDEERPVVRVGMVASYLRFLTDADEIKSNLRKYGRT